MWRVCVRRGMLLGGNDAPSPLLQALQHVTGLLKPGGCIFITQTFENKRNKVMDFIKPLLRYIVTIDFGRVTYRDEFKATIARAGLRMTEDIKLGGRAGREYRLVRCVPDKAK